MKRLPWEPPQGEPVERLVKVKVWPDETTVRLVSVEHPDCVMEFCGGIPKRQVDSLHEWVSGIPEATTGGLA